MGRPDKPVDQTVPARARLADFLRTRRVVSGMTYEQMARDVYSSKATLKRAASGACVPSWATVVDFIETTATAEETLIGSTLVARTRGHELWVRARRATRAPYYVYKAPDPRLIATEADFSKFLRDQHVWAGYPTPGEMQQTVEHPWDLPPSTTRRIIAGEILPVGPHQALAFLKACYLSTSDELEPWLAAAVRAIGSSSGKRDVKPWINAHHELRDAHLDGIHADVISLNGTFVQLTNREKGLAA